MSRYHLQIRLI